MTKREYKKKFNALSKEHDKIVKSHTKATHFLLNLTKTRNMLSVKIKELEDSYKDSSCQS